MKRFGVIGHPVAHSLSPLLHGKAYQALGLDCTYEAIDVPPERLSEAIEEHRRNGFAGLNVTIPHKESVAGIMSNLSAEAKAVRAVNTIIFSEQGITGDNTDVFGFSASVEILREVINRGKVLLLGAGGSSRAVLYALLSGFAPSEIIVCNRTESRASDLVAEFEQHARTTRLIHCSADNNLIRSHLQQSNVVVNCTPLGLSPDVDGCPVALDTEFHPGQTVVDLIYTPLQTRLLSLASRSGARTISGLEMFLHQGARSFELWIGRQMPVDTLRPIIMNELQSKRNGRS